MGVRRPQQARVLAELESHGWRRDSVERNCDWWADEIWLLKSVRVPVGAKAWMVFLVDPEWKGSRSAGEGVIALAADVVRRKEPKGWLVRIPFGRRWERGLAEVVAALQTARVAKLSGEKGGTGRRE